jgi:hypothetical protein
MVETRGAHALPVLVLSPAGERDDRHTLRVGDLTQPAGHFVAIHFRHADIEQHDVRLAQLELLERCRPVVRNMYVRTSRPQQHREALGGVAIVVHDQHAEAHDARSIAARLPGDRDGP